MIFIPILHVGHKVNDQRRSTLTCQPEMLPSRLTAPLADKENMTLSSDADLSETMNRIAAALERLAPDESVKPDLLSADAFLWQSTPLALVPVHKVSRVDIDLLVGVDRLKDMLMENTQRFANGLPANNVLLWGARGMGKSSLVKAVHGTINVQTPGSLVLIEIHREDIESLPRLMTLLRDSERQSIIFCDDLSFDKDETSYKSLKAVLEGGIEGRPDNVLFYATSNRRHLMPRDMMENERSTAINPSEAVEEKISLSDRFGLWLGFHKCSQDEYFKMVFAYAKHHGLKISNDELRAGAIEWTATRGSRSGRVAWQYIQDVAGRLGQSLKPN